MGVSTQGLFRPYLKTFVLPFLSTRLTAPGSPRMERTKFFEPCLCDTLSRSNQLQSRLMPNDVIFSLHFITHFFSLRKHLFLLALRRWGRFARRNVCVSATEIPYVKSVQNPVRSANWSTEQLHCFSYCLQMTDKRQKAKKVKCKNEESLTKQSIFVQYSLL